MQPSPVVRTKAQGATLGTRPQLSARLQNLLGQASIGLGEAHADGRLISFNDKFVEIFGMARNALSDLRIDQLLPEEERARFARLLRRIHSGGPAISEEIRHIRPDGTRVWVNIQILPWTDVATHLLVVVHDETRWKQAGKELKARNAQLEEQLRDQMTEQETVIRELESFNYSVSHDLRTPLRAIRGFAELLLRRTPTSLEPENLQMLQYINDATDRMSDTIDGLLRLSRMSRQELRRQRVELSRHAHTILHALHRRTPRRKARFTIQEGVAAMADPQMVEVILQNLLENAWKFTRNQPLTLIEFGTMERNDWQYYYVKDNGVGFNMDDAKQLFQPFRRLHRASDFEGTGIGLATVQRIVRRHGGRLHAEAEPGKGATFYFTLSRWKGWG